MASLEVLTETSQDYPRYLKALDKWVKFITVVTREIIQENPHAKIRTKEILLRANKFIYHLDYNSLSFIHDSKNDCLIS